MHPSVHRKLVRYFQEPNLRLYSLLGRSFNWEDAEGQRVSSYMTGGPTPARPAPIKLAALATDASSGERPAAGGAKAAAKQGSGEGAVSIAASAAALPVADAV